MHRGFVHTSANNSNDLERYTLGGVEDYSPCSTPSYHWHSAENDHLESAGGYIEHQDSTLVDALDGVPHRYPYSLGPDDHHSPNASPASSIGSPDVRNNHANPVYEFQAATNYTPAGVPFSPCHRDRGSLQNSNLLGENMSRNRTEVGLRPVSDLPDKYRGVFKFGVFNVIQSTCLDKILYTQENLVISAPTGSGKTVLFELAIIRMLSQVPDSTKSVRCVYVAPTKALCAEKQKEWTAKFGGLGVKCCELTGDTFSFGKSTWGDAKDAQIMLTTAEKWDSITRNWMGHSKILSQIKLFLVDEVHVLNESRGSTLEVIVSRMKTQGATVRFLLVSATVPNIDDVANWIGSNCSTGHPAIVFQFSEEFRPCKLTKIVYGVTKPKGQNDFAYAHTLDRRLFSILQEHSQSKPILLFCTTRKGTVTTAKQLAKDYDEALKARDTLPWSLHKRSSLGARFFDKDLNSLAAHGIAVHHAGLNLDDRRTVENLFIEKLLPVIVATSTLAVGVNLPAHMVVIKGVKLYQNGETREYSDLEILQMMGRAGRPQFDNEGIAIILCEKELENKYRALAQGTTTIESSLHKNLVEHLNSEIGLGTITNIDGAKNWLRQSFFFRRIQKNPVYYDIGKKENETWQLKVDAIVMQSISRLLDTQLIDYTERDGSLHSTEFGDIMSKFYIRQSTMRLILDLPSIANIRQILEMMSSAEELSDLKLRNGEKQLYEAIRRHNDIRFSTRKIAGTRDKIFLLVQAIFAGLPLNSPNFKASDGQPYLEAISAFRHLLRIATAVAEVAIVKHHGAQLKNALELIRCFHAKAWEDHFLVLRQIECIGEKSAKVLAENGIHSIQKLAHTTPFRIQELLNRRSPFGSEVLAAAKEFPAYFLNVKEVRAVPSDGESPVEVDLLIECGLLSGTTDAPSTRTVKRTGLEMTTILTLTSDMVFIDFRRIATKALKSRKEFLVTAHLTKPSQIVTVYISSAKLAGVTVTTTYKPSITSSKYPTPDTRPLAPAGIDLDGLEDIPDLWDINFSDDEGAGPIKDVDTQVYSKPKPSPPPHSLLAQRSKQRVTTVRPDGKRECNHPCKDKIRCRHYCCKEGLSEPSRSRTKKKADSNKVPNNHEKPEIRKRDGKRVKITPNFDIELMSSSPKLPTFDGENDEDLLPISEVLKRSRHRTPEKSASQKHDGYPNKRLRLSGTPNAVCDRSITKSSKIGQLDLLPLTQEQPTTLESSPKNPGNVPLFFTSPVSVESTHSRLQEDQPRNYPTSSNQTLAYEDDFYLNEAYLDTDPIFISETCTTSPCEVEKPQDNTSVTLTPYEPPRQVSPELSVARIANFIRRSKPDVTYATCSHERTNAYAEDKTTNEVSVSPPQEPGFDITSANTNADMVQRDPLAELESWLASGAVQIISDYDAFM